MKILVVTNLYPPHHVGGYELGCRDVVEKLRARGHTVRVLTDRGTLTLVAEVTDDLQHGLVATAFGWWQRSAPEGRSVNALTNATVASDDHGSAFFHDTLVEVELLPAP